MDSIIRSTLELPHVDAELHYLSPMAERPRNYTYEPPAGAPRSNIVHEAHTMSIRDMRSIASEVSLDRQGFAPLRHETAVRDLWDDDEVRKVYYPEAEAAIAQATGAARDARPCRPHREFRATAGARPARRRSRGTAARSRAGDQSMAPDSRAFA